MPVLRLQPLKKYVLQTIGRLTGYFKSSTFKRFGLALLFSVALHGLLVHQVLLAVFKQTAENAALLNGNTVFMQAELVNPEPVATAVLPKSIPQPAPAAAPVTEELSSAPAATEKIASSTSDATTSDTGPEMVFLTYDDQGNANTAATSLADSGQVTQVLQNNEPVVERLPAPTEQQELLIGEPSYRKVYRTIETLFDVRTDINASPTQSAVGNASIVFKLDDDALHYQIESLIEPKGFAALFIADLAQTSRGLVGAQGLQPQQYDYAFGNKPDKTYRASFDWTNAQLNLESSKGVKQVPLKIGAQDLLSFMYQFMFVAPNADLQVMMTNGKKLAAYDYRFAGEEIIKTKMGDLNTIHLARAKATEDEKTELWLALDYRYAPVKIRKIEKSGKVYELLATQIKTEENHLNN